MDLKALLVEAKQKVPPVLQVLQTGDETMLDIGGESCTPNLVYISFSRTTCSSLLRLLYNNSVTFLDAPLTSCVHLTFTEPGVCLSLTYLTLVFTGERGCTFCGGLGHRITDCPKLEAMQTKQVTNIGRKDYLAHSSMDF